MSKYYIKVVGRAFPKTTDEILKMIANFKLSPESEASTNGVDWAPLIEFSEFQHAFASAAENNPSSSISFSKEPSSTDFPPIDAQVWYATTDGANQFGPLTASQILNAHQQGKLTPTTTVWRAGSSRLPIESFAASYSSSPALSNPPSAAPLLDGQSVAGTPVELKEWFFSVDGRVGYGPYTISEILTLFEQGRLNWESLVWRQGENSRPMREEPILVNAYHASHNVVGGPFTLGPNSLSPNSLGHAIPPIAGAATSADDENLDGKLSVFEARRRNKRVNLTHMMASIGWIVASACGLMAGILCLLYCSNPVGTGAALCRVLGCGVLLVGMIASCFSATHFFIFLHSFWSAIPRRYARTSAGAAVGVLFVPLYNLYWNFVAFRGGTQCMEIAKEKFCKSGRNQSEKPANSCLGGGTLLVNLYTILFAVQMVIAVGLLVAGGSLADIWATFLDDGPEMTEFSLTLNFLGTITFVCYIFFFPLIYSGCGTTLNVLLVTLGTPVLYSYWRHSKEVGEELSSSNWLMLFVLAFMLLTALVVATYPLLVSIFTKNMKKSALQMNSWRAGVSSERLDGASSDRTTLDDIMNS